MTKKLNRRDFLKKLGVFTGGLAALKLNPFLAFNIKKEDHSRNIKEAKYYKEGNDLAG